MEGACKDMFQGINPLPPQLIKKKPPPPPSLKTLTVTYISKQTHLSSGSMAQRWLTYTDRAACQ